MISAFPIFCFSLFVFSPPSSFPSGSLPPHSSFSIFISSSLRQNKLQAKASTFQTFNATQGSLSLSLSLSPPLCRSFAQESTCLSPSLSLSECYTQESACLSLFLSLCLRGEWDKVHWEQNNRTETQTKDFLVDPAWVLGIIWMHNCSKNINEPSTNLMVPVYPDSRFNCMHFSPRNVPLQNFRNFGAWLHCVTDWPNMLMMQ